MKRILILLLFFAAMARGQTYTFKQGESVSILFVFDSTYNPNRIDDIAVAIGSKSVGSLADGKIQTTANTRQFKLQLTSAETKNSFGGALIISVEDSILGVKKVDAGQIKFVSSSQFNNSAVNTGTDLTVSLEIEEAGITSNATLATIFKGDKGDTGAMGATGANAQNPNFSVATGTAGSNVSVSGSYPNLTLTIPRGKSAYDIAVENGFVGTELQWNAAVEAARLDAEASASAAANSESVAVGSAASAGTSKDSAAYFANIAIQARDTVNAKAVIAQSAATEAAASAASASNIVLGISTSRPSVRPSLLFDFASSKALDPRITFSRNSIATYFDETGTMRTAITNQPRFDHDPVTGESLGLLIEEQRTNLINNTQMAGAIVGTVWAGGFPPTGWGSEQNLGGSLNLIVDALPIERGMQCIDVRYTGVPSSTNPGIFRTNLVTATAGNVYVLSFYAKSVLSSFSSFSTEVHFLDASSVVIGSPTITTHTLTSNLVRYSVVLPTSPANTAFLRIRFRAGGTVGVALDASYRLACPQLELGSFATSYIPTTSTSVTRSGDFARVANFQSINFSISKGTLFAHARTARQTSGGNSPNVVGSGTGVAPIYQETNGKVSTFGSGDLLSTVASYNNFFQATLSYSGSSRSLIVNGSAPITGTYTGNMFGSGGLFTLGARGTNNGAINGHFRSFAYYPIALTTSEMQALTSTGLLSGKNPNQLPTTADLGEMATMDVEAAQRLKTREVLNFMGTGGSVTYTIRRPYPFLLAIVNSTGSTTATLPTANADGTYTENTNYSLIHNAAAGTILTVELIPLLP